ncbi:MAG: hypothetical protein B7X93_04130 [Hydrogenophilales bacterium 17-61-9]|nr:MAG: hypothetical protein B7X93_04130 [Hydrogenophilales bacterium 17-61-9]
MTCPDAPADIVESELEEMLQTIIDARCGLSAIHQLLDGAQTMADIRARFGAWQATQPPPEPDRSQSDNPAG